MAALAVGVLAFAVVATAGILAAAGFSLWDVQATSAHTWLAACSSLVVAWCGSAPGRHGGVGGVSLSLTRRCPARSHAGIAPGWAAFALPL